MSLAQEEGDYSAWLSCWISERSKTWKNYVFLADLCSLRSNMARYQANPTTLSSSTPMGIALVM